MTDRLPVCAEGMNRLAQFNDGVLPSVLAKSGRNREILVFRGLFHTPRLWNRRNAPAGWLSSMTAWTSRPLAGMGKSIPSCRGEINRVFQPPPQLQMVGISSRGRKQGCFQPPLGRPARRWSGRTSGPGGTGFGAAGLNLAEGAAGGKELLRSYYLLFGFRL